MKERTEEPLSEKEKKDFGREELWILRQRAAYHKSIGGTNHLWIAAYEELERAADRLDAMIARTQEGE